MDPSEKPSINNVILAFGVGMLTALITNCDFKMLAVICFVNALVYIAEELSPRIVVYSIKSAVLFVFIL